MSRLEKIKLKMAELEVSPKRSLGQNFLIGEHVISQILTAVKVNQPSFLVEIGPGLGALTDELRKMDVPLILLELDRTFSQHWRDQEIEVYEGDALRMDWNSWQLPENTVLVSNLPYQIGASVVIDRSLGPKSVGSMVLMFQKEVAQRIMAFPKNKEYGFLTVIAQTYWDLRVVVDAGPQQFYPAPNVTSRVLQFRRRPGGPEKGEEFIAFVKAAFAQRRKLLVKNLSALFGAYGVDRGFLVDGLLALGLSDKVRAEELSPEEHVKLFRAFQAKRF